MTYSAAIGYLYGLQKHGIKLGLKGMRALTARIGHPERRFRTIHVGGTNGKGSTAAMTAAILQAAGYRAGLYTSPHLVEFCERIRINGEMIAESRVAELADRLRAAAQPDLEPTFFELTTAMAFLQFAEASVDVAVLEVGLGGRFDATNVVEPIACAITTVALDHQEHLGDTLPAIAFEKAGIIKPAVPVVIGRMETGVAEVIQRVAAERAAPVLRFGQEFDVAGTDPARFSYRGTNRSLDGLACALDGRHQVDNAACAMALLETAGQAGLSVNETAIREGLRSVSWEGRLECVEKHPLVVLDGAHNPAAAEALARYLGEFRTRAPASRIILVLGMMRDKDHRGFMAPLRHLVAEVVLTQADIARAATVRELRSGLEGQLPHLHDAPVPADALVLAKRLAAPHDLICVTGSLMLVGDVKAALRGCGLSPLRG